MARKPWYVETAFLLAWLALALPLALLGGRGRERRRNRLCALCGHSHARGPVTMTSNPYGNFRGEKLEYWTCYGEVGR